MKRIKAISVFLALISIIGISLAGRPLLDAAKVNIRPDIPDYMREQVERLYSQDPVERLCAAFLLGEMGSQASPAIPLLIGMLDDNTTLFRPPGEPICPGREAAIALAKIGEPALDPLLVALKDEDLPTRMATAAILGKIKDTRAVGPLIAALKDPNSSVRLKAAWALGEIKDDRAAVPLIAALKDKSFLVRQEAAVALGKTKTPSALEPLIAALKDEDWDVRAYATLAIALMKNPGAVELLIAALKHPHPDVRYWAMEGLGALGQYIRDPRSVELLLAVLEDGDPKVRASAARALGVIGSSAAVNPLIRALNDNDSYVRDRAAVALGLIRDPRAVRALIATLRDDSSVRDSAKLALERITGDSIDPDPKRWPDWYLEAKGITRHAK